jgi:hypothetical protein
LIEVVLWFGFFTMLIPIRKRILNIPKLPKMPLRGDGMDAAKISQALLAGNEASWLNNNYPLGNSNGSGRI